MNAKTPYAIKCPHCGAEYMPAEIFYPKEFFGFPDVEKDESGRILHVCGEPMSLESEYSCDYCGKRFVAKASVSFSSESSEFDEEYGTPIYGGSVGIFEG